MKTDSLFYYLFQTAPGILFELLGQPAELAEGYEFRSVELKQTAFRIDGVLLPRVSATDSTVFFVEIQFQLDPYFYHRFFAEIFLFLRQNPEMKDWHAVVLFAKRGIEPGQTQPFQPLLESELVSRIFLEDLQENASNSLGIGLAQLVAARPNAAVDLAKVLLGQAREVDSPLFSPAAIYRFNRDCRCVQVPATEPRGH
ncbi:MAG: Rpn family recombination-promoting nuclease/putative transposase [Synechococcus sp.]